MADTSTVKNIRRNIEKILLDNEFFSLNGEYQTNPVETRNTCETARRNKVISNEDYQRYVKLIDIAYDYRKTISVNNYLEKRTEYLKNIKELVFWG